MSHRSFYFDRYSEFGGACACRVRRSEAVAGAAAARPGGGAAGSAARSTSPRRPSFDMASVDRGGKIFAANARPAMAQTRAAARHAKTDVRSACVPISWRWIIPDANCPDSWRSAVPRRSCRLSRFPHDDGVDLATWLHYQVSW